MTTKLTETVVDRLKAPTTSGKQVVTWDTQQHGLGVVCSGVSASKSYVVQHKLPSTKDADGKVVAPGKLVRVTIGPVGIGLERARIDAAMLIANMKAGKNPKIERSASLAAQRTLREALDGYLTFNRAIGQRTRKSYEGSIKAHLSEWLDKPLRDITPTRVLDRHAQIADTIAQRNAGKNSGGGPTVGHATANGVMRSLRAVYLRALDLDPSLPPNPVKLKKSWFDVKPRARTVDDIDMPKFYAAIEGYPSRLYQDLLKLILFTGMRREEAMALRWSECLIPERRIKLATRTKTKRPLDVPMSDFVRDLLVKRRAMGIEGPFVFPSSGKSGHVGEDKHVYAAIAKECGVLVNNHDLRRCYVTAANNTVSGRDASILTSHSVGGDVHSNYDMSTVEHLREPAQRVCDKLKQLCGIVETTAKNVEKIA